MRTWAAAAFILSLHLGLCTTRGARAEDGPAAPMAPRPAESEIVSHLEALVASEEGAAAEYKALGKAEEAAKASRRARTAREQLDDMKCGLRGPLPDRRSPVEVVLEQRHPRYLTNGGPDPVERLLEFLGPLQEADGRWDGGDDDADVEVTSLALIALLGQGETHRSREFGPRVRAAFAFLVEAQDADGLVGSRKGNRVPFRQAAASLALVRACRFSASPVFLKPAWSAVSACLGLRIPGKGWGRGPGATAEDPAATGWMALVLEDARRARLAECLDARVAALRCFERFTEAATGAVRTPAEADATVPASSQGALEAIVTWGRALGGVSVKDPLQAKALERCLAREPGPDPFETLFLTLVKRGAGFPSESWKTWNESAMPAILTRLAVQKGSDGEWRVTKDGPVAVAGRGRLAAFTDLLTLEHFWRYRRALGTDE